MKKILYFFIIMFVAGTSITNLMAQQRLAVLPFKNLDGNLDYNEWCYNIQDSLSKSMRNSDPEEKRFHIVPIDSVELVLAEFNLDPDNP